MSLIFENNSSPKEFGTRVPLNQLPAETHVILSPSYFEADKNGDVWVEVSRDLSTNYVEGYNYGVSGSYRYQVVLARLANGDFVATETPQPWKDTLIAHDIDATNKVKLTEHTLNVFMPKISYTKEEKNSFYDQFKHIGNDFIITDRGYEAGNKKNSPDDADSIIHYRFKDPARYDSAFYIGSFIRCALDNIQNKEYLNFFGKLNHCLDLALSMPIEQIPLYMNEEYVLAQELVKWRLSVAR
jgi:hypothetical protein